MALDALYLSNLALSELSDLALGVLYLFDIPLCERNVSTNVTRSLWGAVCKDNAIYATCIKVFENSPRNL